MTATRTRRRTATPRSAIAIAMAIATLTLPSCHKAGNGAGASDGHGMPLARFTAMAKQRGENAAAARMSVLAGRWESQTGGLANAKGRTLALMLRNDGGFTLMLREGGIKAGRQTITVNGRTSWSDEGILSGGGKSAQAPIAGFASWSATFPAPGRMTIRGSDGTTCDLAYRGSA